LTFVFKWFIIMMNFNDKRAPMLWKMDRYGRGDVELASDIVEYDDPPPTEDQIAKELAAAQAAIQRFRNSGHADATTTATRLDAALRAQLIPWETLLSLSRWCHTGGPYKSGKEPAEAVSRALFGKVLPDLTRGAGGGRIVSLQARDMAWKFLEQCALEERSRQMTVFPPSQPLTGKAKGSQYCIQYYVNAAPEEFEHRIVGSSLSLELALSGIEWEAVLPDGRHLVADIDYLGSWVLRDHYPQFLEFWPKHFPRLDGIGRLIGHTDPGIVLVDARSFPGERTVTCAGLSSAELAQIDSAFARVQGFMGVTPTDWKLEAFELATRLAMLYFLNEIAKIPSWLAQISFVNDPTEQPTTRAEWRHHHRRMLLSLGIDLQSRLLDRIVPVYLDAPQQ
jgi:hypothetical protein